MCAEFFLSSILSKNKVVTVIVNNNYSINNYTLVVKHWENQSNYFENALQYIQRSYIKLFIIQYTNLTTFKD